MTDPQEYRSAVARFATGVTVVTVPGRHPHAMTANAVASVSLEPPTLLVCLEQDARVHDAALEEGRLGVSVLAADQQPVAAWLATRGRPSLGQLDRVPHHSGPVLGVPLVDGALATFECEVVAAHPVATHTVVVAEVRGVGGDAPAADPLLWFASAYRGLSPG
ncbi:flavin reductase family protein [Aquipuribacter nitratireducens]|uniref:Flavin reductase family protein n=1 Tax=Aquipuribacter nitratireducens TaxID=650104 RepID=A0ABW0GLC4_9MICO